jgi:hypothetical protein
LIAALQDSLDAAVLNLVKSAGSLTASRIAASFDTYMAVCGGENSPTSPCSSLALE